MKPEYKEDDLDIRPYIKNSEEIESVPFAWTKELIRLSTFPGIIHPDLGPLETIEPFGTHVFHPDWRLPDPADTRECLRFIGLSYEKIAQVEQRFNELYPDYQGPACGYDEKYWSGSSGCPLGSNAIRFPVLDRMMHVFFGMVEQGLPDYEYTHEGYIKKAIQQGLRPEFAVFCGMHTDDPRCIDDPLLYERDWFDRSPSVYVMYRAESWWRRLKEFLLAKMIHEGKAWYIKHPRGYWLVYEGESMDQAKTRVNNLNFEELNKLAYEKEREEARRRSEENRRRIEMELEEVEAEYRASKGE